MRFGGTYTIHDGGKRCIQNFGLEISKEKPLGRPGYKWEANVKLNLRMIGCEDMKYTEVVQDRVQ
jgi:hypothetical protein